MGVSAMAMGRMASIRWLLRSTRAREGVFERKMGNGMSNEGSAQINIDGRKAEKGRAAVVSIDRLASPTGGATQDNLNTPDGGMRFAGAVAMQLDGRPA